MFCERAFLPVPADDSIERELKIPKLQIPKVGNIAVADTSTNIWFVNLIWIYNITVSL